MNNTNSSYHIAAIDPKHKRIPWSHFDRLLDCFQNDTRIFLISDDDKENAVQKYSMTMADIINFWDGGIEDSVTRLTMLDIMSAARRLQINEQTNEACWNIKRIS
jgi:hypothetical protein